VGAEAGVAIGELALGLGGGLPGPSELAPVQRDQRGDAVDDDQAVALAGLLGQLPGRLELGDGVVPLAGQEAPHRQDGLVQGEPPADAELLADPPAGLEGGPGVLEPVQPDEDVPPGQVHDLLVPPPLGAVVGQPHRLVCEAERPAQVGPELLDDGQRGRGQDDRRVVAVQGHASCLLGRGHGAVQVAQLEAGHGLGRGGAGAQLLAERRGPLHALQLPERVAQPSLGAEGARQQDAGLGLHRRIVLAVQQRAEGRLGLGQPPRPHERAGPVGQQPVPPGVGRVGQATASRSPGVAPRARCSATATASAPASASRRPASRCRARRTLAGRSS
jgi:hypothetical protein